MTDSVSSVFGAVGSIDRHTRRELILARVRESITSGALAPGTHLAEIELREALGVSRGTLREALRHLQQEGMLVSDARGRLSVRRVTAEEVREIFAVREALEALAVAEICEQSDRGAAVEALRAQLAVVEQTGTDFVKQVGADLRFHEVLCEQSGNGTLVASWRNVSGLARAAITAAGPEAALMNMAVERHVPLLDLIESGDAAEGRRFLAEHMASAVGRIVAQMELQEA
ncbi:MAG: GntR family transcriptional regulator [Mycetocola sp.]